MNTARPVIEFLNPMQLLSIQPIDTSMSTITVEHAPSEERLEALKVSNWPTWEKEISEFTIDFDETEVAYVLEGEIIVTPVDGESVHIKPGDLVSFHAGLDSRWQVVKPLRKHYSYDFPDGV
jgi:uncharacterized cupin superfamily protein